MNLLLIGSGGREHALAWKLKQSPLLSRLYIAPGNGGTGAVGENTILDISDHEAISSFCQTNDIALVVIGPEAPLVDGLADSLRKAGIAVFGPTAAAAQLEGSKFFTKQICDQKSVPTAGYAHFTNLADALNHLEEQNLPIVIKADGLAAGKGVTVAETIEAARDALEACFEGLLGDAGAEVIIEECLVGEEVSMFFLCDGETALPFGNAQDHKRVGERDTGPNTGGMGAYSPAPVVDSSLETKILTRIIKPSLEGMKELGTPFSGVLFAGLMITADGPKLIEYNVRFGDPECQVLMMRLASDLLHLLLASAKGELANCDAPSWRDDIALTVVMANQGYPGAVECGHTISLPGIALDDTKRQIFHAGTIRKDGMLLSNGGRVLNITALGKTVSEAQTRAYELLDQINWPRGFCRRDIGWRAIEREQNQ